MTEFDSRDARELKSMEAPKLSSFREPYLQREITIKDDGKTIFLKSDTFTRVVPKDEPGRVLAAVREFLNQ